MVRVVGLPSSTVFLSVGFASATLSSVLGATVIIDNTDPRVVYSGTWKQVPQAEDAERNNYNGTLAYTTEPGAFAQVRFNGTHVSVYGMLENTGDGGMKSHYSLDQRLPVWYEPPTDVTAPQYRVQLWQSAEIALYEHALRIENNGDQYWFDYIEVEVPDSLPPTPASRSATALPVYRASNASTSSSAVVSASSSSLPSRDPSLPSLVVTHVSTTTATLPNWPSFSSESPATSSTDTSTSALHEMTSPIPPISPVGSASILHSAAATTSPAQIAAAQGARGHRIELPKGAVAGLTAGAASIVGSIALVSALWWCRRRKRATAVRLAVTPRGELTSDA